MSSNIEIRKEYSWCGKEFIARKFTTEYCSHRCANLAYKAKKRKEKVKIFEQEYSHKNSPQEEVENLEFLILPRPLNCWGFVGHRSTTI